MGFFTYLFNIFNFNQPTNNSEEEIGIIKGHVEEICITQNKSLSVYLLKEQIGAFYFIDSKIYIDNKEVSLVDFVKWFIEQENLVKAELYFERNKFFAIIKANFKLN